MSKAPGCEAGMTAGAAVSLELLAGELAEELDVELDDEAKVHTPGWLRSNKVTIRGLRPREHGGQDAPMRGMPVWPPALNCPVTGRGKPAVGRGVVTVTRGRSQQTSTPAARSVSTAAAVVVGDTPAVRCNRTRVVKPASTASAAVALTQ